VIAFVGLGGEFKPCAALAEAGVGVGFEGTDSEGLRGWLGTWGTWLVVSPTFGSATNVFVSLGEEFTPCPILVEATAGEGFEEGAMGGACGDGATCAGAPNDSIEKDGMGMFNTGIGIPKGDIGIPKGGMGRGMGSIGIPKDCMGRLPNCDV
jgi:hypothetical protein